MHVHNRPIGSREHCSLTGLTSTDTEGTTRWEYGVQSSITEESGTIEAAHPGNVIDSLERERCSLTG